MSEELFLIYALVYFALGMVLGFKTSYDSVKFRVYTVKDDEDHEYLFRLWEWEGAFYKKEESAGRN